MQTVSISGNSVGISDLLSVGISVVDVEILMLEVGILSPQSVEIELLA